MTPPSEWENLSAIAEQDIKALEVLLKTDVILPVSCFHAQQACEKYFKAVLSYRKIRFPYTHDLTELYDLLHVNHIFPSISRLECKKLNPFAVKQRYDMPPEVHVTREEVRDIVKATADWCKKQLL